MWQVLEFEMSYRPTKIKQKEVNIFLSLQVHELPIGSQLYPHLSLLRPNI